MTKPSAATQRCMELVRRFDHEFTQSEYEVACKKAGITCIRLDTLAYHGAIDIIAHKRAIRAWTPQEFIEYLQDAVFGADCYQWYPDIEWVGACEQYIQSEVTHYTYVAREVA